MTLTQAPLLRNPVDTPIAIGEMAISMRTTLLAFAAWFTLASAAWGQRLSFGVVGGTNLTDGYRTVRDSFTYLGNTYTNLTYSDSRSLIVGPMLELGLPNQWSIEVDALHRTLKNKHVTDFPGLGVSAPNTPFHASAPTWVAGWEANSGVLRNQIQVLAGVSF